MIEERDVRVGYPYLYPHPDGTGMVRVYVRRITRATRDYPRGRVLVEAPFIGQGTMDTMEVFTKNAERLDE